MEEARDLYRKFLVGCFIQGDPFLNYLDIEYIVQVFDEKMNFFLQQVQCNLANEKGKMTHEALSYFMIHELIEGLINELYNPEHIITDEELNHFPRHIAGKGNTRTKKYLNRNKTAKYNKPEYIVSEFFKAMYGKVCDNIFEKYNLLFMILSSQSEEKIEAEFKLLLLNEQNKRRSFPIEFMRKVKEIEEKTKKDRPKPTQIDCILLANKELNTYNENLLIGDKGDYTQFLISLRDSYKAQKNNL